MPRIACIATGRPSILSCRRPAVSVQGWSSSIAWLKATSASSRAMRRMVAAEMPQVSATTSGAYSAVQVAFGQQMEHRIGAAAVRQNDLTGDLRLHVGGGGIHRRARGAVPGQWLAVGIAHEQPVIGAAGIRTTSQAALV